MNIILFYIAFQNHSANFSKKNKLSNRQGISGNIRKIFKTITYKTLGLQHNNKYTYFKKYLKTTIDLQRNLQYLFKLRSNTP